MENCTARNDRKWVKAGAPCNCLAKEASQAKGNTSSCEAWPAYGTHCHKV